VISHGPKFREPQHINWKHNFKIITDAVEDYARRWIKREVDAIYFSLYGVLWSLGIQYK
jgi:hypothetical protein